MNEEKIIINSIGEITKALEDRIQVLMNNFMRFENELAEYSDDGIDFDKISDPKIMDTLNKMLDIFIEFKPIERLIRFKYKELNDIFDRLVEIESERIHGKFFSFLRCLPSRKRRYTKKLNPFIKNSLTNQSTIK